MPAWLREEMKLHWQRMAGQQVITLASQAPTHPPLDSTGGMAILLDRLGVPPADEETVVIGRAASCQIAAEPRFVAELLDGLREPGADEQAATLASRLPAAGMFELFLRQPGASDQFRFGREADGTPTAPWSWDDLD